ncbi:hypothetical protein [Comamonas endophytica]|uniref:Uncharacterized protein n=1 Tax=Comamonas endophytica TaxID=2949090 RepID=A0ABY6GEN3_9BURK|nr:MULTISPECIES: hypothetical protein [unclassified Acidovorax]MCD2514302.1 hypothetical protein [Acidovorax sp. D4N7]UYG53551.1 hypothetical protein M9799_19495 [Acidovorax sp. 5MLIR]
MNYLSKLMVLLFFPLVAMGAMPDAVKNGRPVAIELPSKFLHSIDALEKHARNPSSHGRLLLPAIEFCDCTLVKVLYESDNRQTLFFEP